MLRSGKKEHRYRIGAVARMVGVHSQTLRYYERVGLVEPMRSAGNVRSYSEEDVALLRRIKTLMNDLGVNLAGAEVILRLTERMAEMGRAMEETERRFHERDQAVIETERRER